MHRRITISIVAVLLALATPAEAKSSRGKKRPPSKAKSSQKGKASKSPASAGKPEAPVWFSTVVVDAGHGGYDPGGIPANIIPEKNVALDVARRLRMHLESAGLRVVMTRRDDTFVSLGERVRIANAERNAIFVSIHFNASWRASARGVETFYCSAASAPLARLIQEKMLAVTRNPDYRPVKRASFAVLRGTRCAAVLAECGFLTNREDAEFALRQSSREKLAAQIAAAVLKHRKSLTR